MATFEAALRRNDADEFLAESEIVKYHKTKHGAVKVKSTAVVSLPHDDELKHLDVVIWFDHATMNERGDVESPGPVVINYGMREKQEDFVSLEGLRKVIAEPILGRTGRWEWAVRIYSWLDADAVQLFHSEKMLHKAMQGRHHHFWISVKGCGTRADFLFAIQHGERIAPKNGQTLAEDTAVSLGHQVKA